MYDFYPHAKFEDYSLSVALVTRTSEQKYSCIKQKVCIGYVDLCLCNYRSRVGPEFHPWWSYNKTLIKKSSLQIVDLRKFVLTVTTVARVLTSVTTTRLY